MDKKKTPWYDNIEKFLIVVLFLIMLVILFVNVVTRFVFHYTASWSEQASRILFVWLTFCGVSLAGMTDAHLRVTLANMIFGEKKGKIIFAIGDIISVLFSLWLVYKIGMVMVQVLVTKQVFAAIPWLPAWILYLAGVLGMAGFTIRVIQRMVRQYRKSGKKEKIEEKKEAEA